MKKSFQYSRVLNVILLVTMTFISSACAQQSNNTEKQRKGPPAEAFTACQNKSSGSSCSVQTPRGTMTGTCIDRKSEGKLVCAPEGVKESRPSR